MADFEHNKVLANDLANRTTTEVVLETSILVFIASTALVGNSCVLCVFYKSPRLRTVTNYYVIALAISDVSLTLIVIPCAVAAFVCGRDVIGHQAGQVIGFITLSLALGSLQTTHLIAVNRYFCIVKPNIYKRFFKSRPAILSIIGAWIFTIFFNGALYWIGVITFTFHPGMASYFVSSFNQSTERVISGSSILMFVILPMLITIFCYWKVYRVVKGHSASVSSTINAWPAGDNSFITKEEIHITRCVLALVCGFVACWIPCTTVLHLSTYFNLPRRVELIAIYTASFSSAINPILFNIFNKCFRAEFLNVFGLTNPNPRPES